MILVTGCSPGSLWFSMAGLDSRARTRLAFEAQELTQFGYNRQSSQRPNGSYDNGDCA